MFPLIFLLTITPIFGINHRIITTTNYSTFRVTLKIVNGNPARKGQYPYMVSLKEPIQNVGNNKKLWSNMCGGSIINEKHVLTAAHCFDPYHGYYKRRYDLLRIVAGSLKNKLIHNDITKTAQEEQWRSIKQLRIHKHFHFPEHDIALLTMNEDFVFNQFVNYVIPARANKIDYPRTCMSVGFGRLGQSKKSNISEKLMWADISILSRTQCNVWWEVNMDKFLCSNTKITDIAEGDSGGPLTCYGTLDKAERRNKDLLVGIVSGKSAEATALYTRVAAYKDWLEGSESCGWRTGPMPLKLVVILCLTIKVFCICLLVDLFVFL